MTAMTDAPEPTAAPENDTGLFFTEREREHVSNAMQRLAAAYEKHGDTEVASELADLMRRILDHHHGRGGMPESRQEHWQRQLMGASQFGDPENVVEALTGWWTEVLRLEPDPAGALAGMLGLTLRNSGKQVSEIFMSFARQKIVAVRYRHPGSAAGLDELLAWIAVGEKNLEDEVAPWDDDPDITPPDVAAKLGEARG